MNGYTSCIPSGPPASPRTTELKILGDVPFGGSRLYRSNLPFIANYVLEGGEGCQKLPARHPVNTSSEKPKIHLSCDIISSKYILSTNSFKCRLKSCDYYYYYCNGEVLDRWEGIKSCEQMIGNERREYSL